MKTKSIVTAVASFIMPLGSLAAAVIVNSSSFNAVTDGAVVTAGASDWGFVSTSGGFFDSDLNSDGESYNATPYDEIENNEGSIRTTISGSSSIGEVTLTEGTTSAMTAGTDRVVAQNNTSNFTFDGITAFGSYGNLAPGEEDAWELIFNDLGVGQHEITLYLGHSRNNRSFHIGINGVDDETLSGQVGDLGSTVAGIGTGGSSFTYDLNVTITDASDDVVLTFGDSGGGAFGQAIFAGYTVRPVPEPSVTLLMSLAVLSFFANRRR